MPGADAIDPSPSHPPMPPSSPAPMHSVASLTARARSFLDGQRWVSRVQSVTPVLAIEGDLGVFRCALIPSQPDADVMVWVVVGDLPSAWVPHEPGDSWQDALHGYVAELGRWVEAARSGAPVDALVPVDLPPTAEHAERLATRLEHIRASFVDVDPDTVRSGH